MVVQALSALPSPTPSGFSVLRNASHGRGVKAIFRRPPVTGQTHAHYLLSIMIQLSKAGLGTRFTLTEHLQNNCAPYKDIGVGTKFALGGPLSVMTLVGLHH